MNTEENKIPALLELDGSSGELVPSDRFDGYVEFQPSDEVRLRIESYLANEMSNTIADYQPLWNECRENIETYKASKFDSGDGEQVLPSPLARIAADQVISWMYNTILRPKPLLSVEPYFPREYDVMIPVDIPDEMGQMQKAAVPVPRDAEKVAMTWELGYEFLLRERIGIAKKVQQIATDTVTGAAPCWVKVCYHNETRTVMEPQKSGPVVDLSDKRERDIAVGDPVKWLVLPTFNVIRPVDEPDVQASPWIAEWIPSTPDDFLLAFYRGDYPLITEEDAQKCARSTSDFSDYPKTDTDRLLVKAEPSARRQKNDIWEVWLYWDVKLPAPDGSKRKLVKRLSLMGHFHRGAGKLLSLFRNPYDHQMRPYVPFFQIEDPHTLSGSSTVGVVKYHQRVKTQLLGLELQNAAAANNNSFFVDPDSDAFNYLAGNRRLRPNEVIPKRQDEYVEPFRKGVQHYSLLPLVQYTDNDGMRAVNVSAYETGQDIPGRTPAATVSQILQQGANQPLMFLRTVSDRLVEAIKLDLRTRRQFYPLGETLHVTDPETQQLLEVLFQFPVEDAIDNFRFAMTASDEEQAKEHEIPQLMALQKMNQDRSNFIAMASGPMANPQLTAPQRELILQMLASDQAIADRIIGLTRTDTKKFDYTETLKAIADAATQAAEEAKRQQEMMMMAQMGGMNGGPAQPGGALPGPGGGPGGPSGLPPEPGLGVGPMPPPPEALPPPGMGG